MDARRTSIDIVTLYAGPDSTFPALDDDPAVIRVAIEKADTDGCTFAVATNLGRGLTAEHAATALAVTLRRLAHALASGATIDLSNPTAGAS